MCCAAVQKAAVGLSLPWSLPCQFAFDAALYGDVLAIFIRLSSGRLRRRAAEVSESECSPPLARRRELVVNGSGEKRVWP